MECTLCHTPNPAGVARCRRCNTPLPLPNQTEATMDGSVPWSPPPTGNPPAAVSTPQVQADAASRGLASGWSSPAPPRTAGALRPPLQAGSLLGERYEIL